MPRQLSKDEKKRLKREYLKAHPDNSVFAQARRATARGSRATTGERAFAWVFCFVYLTVTLAVLAMITGFVVVAVWGDAPAGLGLLIPVIVITGAQYLVPIAAEWLSRSRSMGPHRRLARMIADIHRNA